MENYVQPTTGTNSHHIFIQVGINDLRIAPKEIVEKVTTLASSLEIDSVVNFCLRGHSKKQKRYENLV